MRDQWYSDKRDLVKWSVLLHLAEENRSDRIIQIAYYNPSEFSDIQIDGRSHPIQDKVISHFRNIGNISTLTTSPKITVFDSPFKRRARKSYLDSAIKHVDSFAGERCIVFLDPDTGLEPKGKANHTHVTNQEVSTFWAAIKHDWILVFYQHQNNKNGGPWIEPKRAQFAEAANIPLESVKLACSPKLANDVVFFFALKS